MFFMSGLYLNLVDSASYCTRLPDLTICKVIKVIVKSTKRIHISFDLARQRYTFPSKLPNFCTFFLHFDVIFSQITARSATSADRQHAEDRDCTCWSTLPGGRHAAQPICAEQPHAVAGSATWLISPHPDVFRSRSAPSYAQNNRHFRKNNHDNVNLNEKYWLKDNLSLSLQRTLSTNCISINKKYHNEEAIIFLRPLPQRPLFADVDCVRGLHPLFGRRDLLFTKKQSLHRCFRTSFR